MLLRRALGRESRAILPFGTDPAMAGDPYGGWVGPGVPPPTWVPQTSSGAVVTELSALQLSAFYACVRLIADSVASLPWNSYRTNADAPVKVDPLPSLLRRPHPDMTAFDWKYQMMTSLVIRGNFYGLVTARDALEYPSSILPLHPDWVVLNRDPRTGNRTFYVNGERYSPDDILHVRGFTLPGYDLGLSQLQAGRQAIGLGLAAEDFGGKWFRDGAAPSSVLQSDLPLTKDQVEQAQQQWIATHGGRRRPAVLGGGLKFNPVTITPEESQFLETRKFQVSEIARMMGVPPHMIGDVDRSTSWGTGIEQMSVGFVRWTLVPWLERIEAALGDVTPRTQYVKFDTKQLLRGTLQERYEAFRVAIDTGFMCPDEARAEEDLPPIPGGLGQNFRQPLNFGPLGYDPTEAAITEAQAIAKIPPPPAPQSPTTPPAKSATPSSNDQES